MATFVDPYENENIEFVDPIKNISSSKFVDPAKTPSVTKDVFKQAALGPIEALTKTSRGLEALMPDYKLPENMSEDNLGERFDRIGTVILSNIEKELENNKPETVAGEFSRGVSKFLTGFGVGKKVMGAVGVKNALLKAFGAGAIADYSVFGAHEQRLSNLIESVPALQNPVTEYLQAKEDDSEIEGRIKSVLEGAGLGGAIEGVLRGIRLVKGARQAKQAVTKTESVASTLDLSTDIKAAKEKMPKVMQQQIIPDGKAFTPKVRVEVTEKAIEMTEDALLGNRDNAKRISQQISELLQAGEIHPEYLPEILKKYNMTPAQFATELRETASFAGKTLNRYSQIAKRAGKYFPEDSEAAKIFGELERSYESTLFDKITHFARKIENYRRGLLVTQLTTAVRNAVSQTGRITASVVDEGLQTVLMGARKPTDFTKMVMADLNAANSIVGSLARGKNRVVSLLTGKPIKQTLLDDVLDANQAVLSKARLLSQPVHEVMTKGEGLLHHLNTFNRVQENFFRKLAFEAKLRQLLGQQGKRLGEIDPASIDEKILTKSVDYALEMSFAASPKTPAARAFINGWSNSIVGTLINPFPRFNFANALPFMYQHSPLGFFDVLRYSKYGQKAFVKAGIKGLENGARTEAWTKSASRATLGTLALWSAWHLRQSDHAGERWYELKSGEKTFDMRSYAPLTTYLFFAEAIQDKINGTNKIKPGDYIKMAIGLNRIAGSGLVLVDMMRAEKPETIEKMAADFAGQYIGSFGVPARTVKDVVAAFSTKEAIVRDVKTNPLWAPFVNNIPFLSQKLPEMTTPYRTGIEPNDVLHPIRMDETTFKLLGVEGAPEVPAPLARQFFGITARIKNPLEKEVDRLDVKRARFYARTGDPEANRMINGYAGYLNEIIMVPVVQSEQWANLSDPEKRYLMGEMETKIKQAAANMYVANHSGKALKLNFEKMDKDMQDILGPALMGALKNITE